MWQQTENANHHIKNNRIYNNYRLSYQFCFHSQQQQIRVSPKFKNYSKFDGIKILWNKSSGMTK